MLRTKLDQTNWTIQSHTYFGCDGYKRGIRLPSFICYSAFQQKISLNWEWARLPISHKSSLPLPLSFSVFPSFQSQTCLFSFSNAYWSNRIGKETRRVDCSYYRRLCCLVFIFTYRSEEQIFGTTYSTWWYIVCCYSCCYSIKYIMLLLVQDALHTRRCHFS